MDVFTFSSVNPLLHRFGVSIIKVFHLLSQFFFPKVFYCLSLGKTSIGLVGLIGDMLAWLVMLVWVL